MAGDGGEREVRGEKRVFEDREGAGHERRDRVDGAAAGDDPLVAAADRAVQRGRDAVEGHDEGEDQQCAADGGHEVGPQDFVVASSVNFEGHFVTSESRSPTKVVPCLRTVMMTSRPSRKGSGIAPV